MTIQRVKMHLCYREAITDTQAFWLMALLERTDDRETVKRFLRTEMTGLDMRRIATPKEKKP